VDPVVRREADAIVGVLVGLGHGKREARERVERTLLCLSDLGRRPTGDEIFNLAVRDPSTMKELVNFARPDPAPDAELRRDPRPPPAGEGRPSS
jgi:hypothetical protein